MEHQRLGMILAFLGKPHFRIDECTRAERYDQQEKQVIVYGGSIRRYPTGAPILQA
jgi:hypothetical protein